LSFSIEATTQLDSFRLEEMEKMEKRLPQKRNVIQRAIEQHLAGPDAGHHVIAGELFPMSSN
jgi:hypothetical protein